MYPSFRGHLARAGTARYSRVRPTRHSRAGRQTLLRPRSRRTGCDAVHLPVSTSVARVT